MYCKTRYIKDLFIITGILLYISIINVLVSFFDKLLRNITWHGNTYMERIFTYQISETTKWLHMFTEFKIYRHEGNKLCKPMFSKKHPAKLLARKKSMQKKIAQSPFSPPPPAPQISNGPSLTWILYVP